MATTKLGGGACRMLVGLGLGVVLLETALFAGCAGLKKANPLVPGPASCGDPCESMTCPSGLHCTWTTQCSPRCEPTPMGGR